jgi:exopolysaccharide production protein ExoZ
MANAATLQQFVLFRVYGHIYTNFFIVGVLVYYVWNFLNRFKASYSRRIFIAIAILVAVEYIGLNVTKQIYNDMRIFYFVPLAAVLTALLLHSAGVRCRWKPLLILGDASYALYLVQGAWLPIQKSFAADWPVLNYKDSAGGMLIALSICCLLAVIIHYMVEKPMIHFLQRKLLPQGRLLRNPIIAENNDRGYRIDGDLQEARVVPNPV